MFGVQFNYRRHRMPTRPIPCVILMASIGGPDTEEKYLACAIPKKNVSLILDTSIVRAFLYNVTINN